MIRLNCTYWLAAAWLITACGSRRLTTAETNGECHDDCSTREVTTCESVDCSVSADSRANDSGANGSGTPGDDSTDPAPSGATSAADSSASLSSRESNGSDGTATEGDTETSGVCSVAYVEYPEGALVPVDGCGSTTCTCDGSGDLVDCTEPATPCSFDGSGPIRHCDEISRELDPFDNLSGGDGYILGGTLILDGAGSCARHEYNLCFRNRSETVQNYDVILLRDTDVEGDSCQDDTQTTLQFDLTPMAEHLMARLGTNDGYIMTQYGVYTFGELTCAHRELAARVDVTRLINSIDRVCSRDEDCISTRFTEDCTEECNAVSRVDQVFRFDRLSETLRAGACAGYLDDGCVQQFPLCERRSAICLAGKCELAPL